MRYLLTVCLVWASLSLLSAQGWVRTYPQDTTRIGDIIRISNKNFVMAIDKANYAKEVDLVKLDSIGQAIQRVSVTTDLTYYYGDPSSIWYKSHTKLLNCEDGDFVLVCRNGEKTLITKFGTDFNKKWEKIIDCNAPKVRIKNDKIFIAGSLGFFNMVTIGLDGNIISEVNLQTNIIDFEVVNDGFIVLSVDGFDKLDINGNIVKKTIHGLASFVYQKTNIIATTNNEFIIAIDSFPSFYKINSAADIIWKKNNYTRTPYIVPLANRNFLTFSQPYDWQTVINNKYSPTTMIYYNSNGDSTFLRQLPNSILNKYLTGVTKIDKNEFIYYGISMFSREIWNGNQVFSIKVDSLGNPYTKSITGYLKLDEDKNCSWNVQEKGINNAIITATDNSNQTFIGITDSRGYFSIGLNNGTYLIKPDITQLSKYLSLCTPSVSATVVDGKAPDTVKFSIKPLISAPLMQVDITTPFLRRCFSNTYYVQYCNKGTTLAQNAFVDITLDSLLEYQSATLPLKSKTGNIYRFNLGNVDINDCGRFEITARVRCGDSTRLNQTLCVKAKIYPDTTGTPTTSWSGANITIKGGCIGDTAVFIIKNEGTAASKSLKAKAYINEDVYEGFNVQLPAGGVMTKKYKSDKKTWRITSDQEPNHPNSTRPTAFVEPCSNEPILSLQSPAMAFSADDYALSIDEDCQPIRGAYDPNDKTGYPFGKKSIGQIPANQDLEYLIRFQNTGTDTAFTVVIKDTLPLTLDPTTIEWGTSSHPYTPSFEGKNTVIFTFNNILLVDSFTNEPKSHGFVRFRIKQMPNLQNGTKIQNSAGIYFDFNPPIITNKTLHTIGADEFLSPVIETTERTNTIIVSPNPFTDKTHFKLENPLLSTGQLEIFDLNGRLLQTEVVKGQEFDFNKKNLKSGIYIFKITENGQIIGQGKIAVQ